MPRALRTRSARSDSSSSRTEIAEDIHKAYHEVSYLSDSIRVGFFVPITVKSLGEGGRRRPGAAKGGRGRRKGVKCRPIRVTSDPLDAAAQRTSGAGARRRSRRPGVELDRVDDRCGLGDDVVEAFLGRHDRDRQGLDRHVVGEVDEVEA